MPRLPNVDRVVIDPRKVIGYLLDVRHPVGGPKARFLMSFGFSPRHPEQLGDALREHARKFDAIALPATPIGTKYVVRGLLQTPDGRGARVRTIWIVPAGEAVARFVTAVPD